MYEIDYIYIGQLEKNGLLDQPKAYAKFAAQNGKELERVYKNDQVSLYKVLPRID